MASYREAGFGTHVQTFVFADGVVPPTSDQHVHVHKNASVKGNLRNWHDALDTIFHCSDADWLMICEDDITWAKGAYAALHSELSAFMVSTKAKSYGMLSLFCPQRVSAYLEKRYGLPLGSGWYGFNHGMKTWGAQCFLFSRHQAWHLLNNPYLKNYLQDPKWHKNVDAIVAECLMKVDAQIAYRIPALVDHVLGYGNSSLGYKEDRPGLKSRYFTGEP